MDVYSKEYIIIEDDEKDLYLEMTKDDAIDLMESLKAILED